MARTGRSRRWYAASIILFLRLKRRKRQRTFIVYENVYLIHAIGPEKAKQRAERLGRNEVVPDPSLTVNGAPAEFVYGGIRKIVECAADPTRKGGSSVNTIYDGVEATYSRFEIRGRRSLEALISGKPAEITYVE